MATKGKGGSGDSTPAANRSSGGKSGSGFSISIPLLLLSAFVAFLSYVAVRDPEIEIVPGRCQPYSPLEGQYAVNTDLRKMYGVRVRLLVCCIHINHHLSYLYFLLLVSGCSWRWRNHTHAPRDLWEFDGSWKRTRVSIPSKNASGGGLAHTNPHLKIS